MHQTVLVNYSGTTALKQQQKKNTFQDIVFHVYPQGGSIAKTIIESEVVLFQAARLIKKKLFYGFHIQD